MNKFSEDENEKNHRHIDDKIIEIIGKERLTIDLS
jgi:hypothetical protein